MATFTWMLALVIIGINIYFMVDFVLRIEDQKLLIPIGIVIAVWILFCGLLVYYAFVFTFFKSYKSKRLSFTLAQMNGEST